MNVKRYLYFCFKTKENRLYIEWNLLDKSIKRPFCFTVPILQVYLTHYVLVWCTVYNLWTFTWSVHFELPFRLEGTDIIHTEGLFKFLSIHILCSVFRTYSVNGNRPLKSTSEVVAKIPIVSGWVYMTWNQDRDAHHVLF